MGRAGLWPDQPFNFTLGTLVGGTITVTARALTVANDMTLHDAKATLALSPTGLALKDISGRGTGGTWVASVKLDRAAAGAQLAATLALSQGSLESLGGTGPVAGTLQLNGKGMSPSGLVSALTGSGTIVLGATRITQISAQKLKLAMEKALNAEPDKLGTVLRSELDSASAVEPVTVGPRQIAVEIKDGVARTQPFQADSAEGKVTPQARLDLSTLVLDGEWRVDSKLQPAPVSAVPANAGVPPPRPKVLPPLPGVVVSVRLPVASLGATQGIREIGIAMDALERELAVRKVERDLDELERLRQLDELRLKERSRLQADEVLQRDVAAKAAAEAKAAPEIKPAAAVEAPAEGALPPPSAIAPTTPQALPVPPQPKLAPRPNSPRGNSSEDWKRALGIGGG